MTVLISRWSPVTPDKESVKEIMQKGQVTSLTAKALVMAGCGNIEEAAAFFGQGEDERYHPAEYILGMEKAAGIVNEAVESGKRICIYGDYDCDGITATAVMADYLESIGADVHTYINERSEGYGMNLAAVRQLADEGTELIITVDNGIAAVDEAKLCRELGMDLVITDHHMPGDVLPECSAIVDPHRKEDDYPFKDLCGCGLALKLIAAMEGADTEFAVEQYGDLGAIATIADVVPLRGENRQIVTDGLRVLENTERIGLKKLIEKSSLKEINSTSVAFGIAPKINAAGRIASPKDALALLLCDDEEEADELAQKVIDLNTQRQSLTEEKYSDIADQISREPEILNRRTLVFCGSGWHHGVIGIAAARIMENFGKPTFILTEEPDELRGSARAFGSFNVFDSLVYSADHLTKKGGHAGAGGFSLEKSELEAFRDSLEEYAASLEKRPVPEITACADISPEELTAENAEGLEILEPFGEGNPKPVFLLTDCVITAVSPLSGGVHTRLGLRYGDKSLEMPLFGRSADCFPYKSGDSVNILAGLEVNEYKGRKSLRLKYVDMRPKGLKQERLIAAEEHYDRFRRGEIHDRTVLDAMRPDRNELAVIYRMIDGKTPLEVCARCGTDSINLCKVLCAFDIFAEAGLIEYSRSKERAKVIHTNRKADLSLTPTMKML